MIMSQVDFDFKRDIEKIRNNLLDMSLKNNLLNFRPRKKKILRLLMKISHHYIKFLLLKNKK